MSERYPTSKTNTEITRETDRVAHVGSAIPHEKDSLSELLQTPSERELAFLSNAIGSQFIEEVTILGEHIFIEPERLHFHPFVYAITIENRVLLIQVDLDNSGGSIDFQFTEDYLNIITGKNENYSEKNIESFTEISKDMDQLTLTFAKKLIKLIETIDRGKWDAEPIEPRRYELYKSILSKHPNGHINLIYYPDEK